MDGWDDDLYGEYSPHADLRHDHMRMWRTPEWKLVRHFTWSRRDELYHLASDPGETKNRIHDPDVQGVVRRLHARILRRMRELDDPVLEVLAQEQPEMLRER